MPSIVFSAQACCAFEDAITRTTEALKAQGFGLISDIDVRPPSRPSSASTARPIASSAPVRRATP